MIDKVFALYWCLCVSISIIFLLSGVKWIRMWSNRSRLILLTMTTPNSIPEPYVALIKLLIYPISTCTTERCSRIMKRLKPPLRSTAKGDERLSSLAILPCTNTKTLIDKVGVLREFACLVHVSPIVCKLLDGVTVLPFFPYWNTVPYLKLCLYNRRARLPSSRLVVSQKASPPSHINHVNHINHINHIWLP